MIFDHLYPETTPKGIGCKKKGQKSSMRSQYGPRKERSMNEQNMQETLEIVEQTVGEEFTATFDKMATSDQDEVIEETKHKMKKRKTQEAQIRAQEGMETMLNQTNQNSDDLNGVATSSERDYAQQHRYVEELKKRGEAGFSLVATEAFVEGMRDSGYKSTGTAIDEFIDNSIQAAATRIDIAYEVRGNDIKNIAVIDDGHGMEPDMIRAAVVWGGTHRHNNRKGFGRFGFGLPSAAVSITKQYEVYSRTDGHGWHKVTIDLPEICGGTKYRNEQGVVVAPPAIATELPEFVKEYLGGRKLDHGTVIFIREPDRLSSGFKKKSGFHNNLMEHIGLIYRNLLRSTPIYLNGKKIEPVDPLFLDPMARYYDVGNDVTAIGRDELALSVKTADSTKTGMIKFRFSLLPPPGFQRNQDGSLHKGRFSIMNDTESYFIVNRAGRQIDLVRKAKFADDNFNKVILNYDRNWAVELDFDPVLDEDFGITVNKQQVSISDRVWDILQDQGVGAMIKSLWSDAEKMRKEKRAATPKPGEEIKDSEAVMTEAEKFFTTPSKSSPEKEEKAKVKVIEEAKRKSKESGRPETEHIKELAEEIHKRPYKIEYENRGAAAPFYRTELFGARLNLYINKDHSFFIKLYAADGSSPRLRSALEVLLFVLGYCEAKSSGDRELFYQSERAEWSKRLNVTLNLLDRKEPTEAAEEAAEFADEKNVNTMN